MKTIVILFTLIASHVVMAEDMQKYLSETQELAREGNHKEALERHIAIGKRDDALTIQKRALALVKDERLEKVMPSVPLSK